ncbi:MAG: hypothetical protein M1837_001061 [Sclerophora amabilis]|nr:MAG: hypothetical protein M1837_001061 [Sclerophora amabilis]
MALVNYSDSESSEAEGPAASSTPVVKTNTSSSSKPAFQKVVDRSNPHKIRVNLATSSADASEDRNGEEPAAKRPRIGGAGAFSGFNSLLPAPKKSGQSSVANGLHSKKEGLGKGVNLKTGSAPGFSRERGSTDIGAEETSQSADGHLDAPQREPFEERPPPLSNGKDDPYLMRKSEPDPKPIEKPKMFKPLSVARKPRMQKTVSASSNGSQIPTTNSSTQPQTPKATPKVSLFSLTEDGSNTDSAHSNRSANREYKPLIHSSQLHPERSTSPSPPSPPEAAIEPLGADPFTDPTTDRPDPNSLTGIANDLNLSQSEVRQLLGRQPKQRGANLQSAAINVKNFNVDSEYAANEALRATGETVQHNPVRAIAPGKHNLKQLVNAVSTQKDALEEEFAKGRRNKKEAGGRYGW